MVIRELISRFGFKTDTKQFKKANDGFASLKKAAVALATVLVAGKLTSAIRGVATETAALGDQLDKVSEKLGINVAALQELRFAAELTGVSQQTMDMALQRFARRSAEAAEGTGAAKDALSELGVKLRDSAGELRPVEDLLGDVAEGMRKTKGDGNRLRLAFKLFDSEGAALVTTLKGGKSALDDMRKAARETGGVLDKELIAASVEYTDTQTEFAMVVRGFKNLLAKQLIPAFTKTTKGVISWVKANREWLSQEIGKRLRQLIDMTQRLSRAAFGVIDAIRVWSKSMSPLSSEIFKTVIAMGLLAVALVVPGGSMILFAALAALIVSDLVAWWENTGKVNTATDRLDQALGGVLGVMRDIIKNDEEWDILGTAFGDWADEAEAVLDVLLKISDVIKRIVLGPIVPLLRIVGELGDAVSGKKGKAALIELLNVEKSLIGALGAGRGAGPSATATASPAVLAGSAGGPQNFVELAVNVQAPPGQEPEHFGVVISKAIDERLASTLRKASRDFSPALAATPR